MTTYKIKLTNKKTGQTLTGTGGPVDSSYYGERIRVDGDELRYFSKDFWDIEEIVDVQAQFKALSIGAIFSQKNAWRLSHKINESEFVALNRIPTDVPYVSTRATVNTVYASSRLEPDIPLTVLHDPKDAA